MKCLFPLCLILLFVFPASAQKKQSSIAITHVTVIDMTGAPPKPEMTVLITGDHITAIGRADRLPIPNGSLIINGSGKFLIPGLWDMHVHFTEVERSFPMFIANGVTGIRNMGGDLDQLIKWRSEVAAGNLLGPRVLTCGPILDGPQPAAHGPVLKIANAEEGRQAVDMLKARGADCVKVYDLLPREAYFAIIDEAHKLNIPVVGHVPLALTSEEASNAGQRSIEHLGNIFESASTLSAELLRKESSPDPVIDPSDFPRRIASRGERMLDTYDPKRARAIFAAFVKNNTWQVPTLEVKWTQTFFDDLIKTPDERLNLVPASERQWWTPQKNFFARYRTPEYIVYRKRLYRKELQMVRAMHRAGVRFMTGTDLSGAYVFAGSSVHHELALFVEAGFSPLEALQTATRNPAVFLGEEKSLGTVEKGKIANLVLLSADPLADIRNVDKIDAVILNGQFLSAEKLKALLAGAEASAKRGQ